MKKDGYIIELVSPYDNESIVSTLIKQYKNSPYHICYIADDFEKACDNFKKEKYVMIDEPMVAPAFNGKKVVFFMSHILGMVELLEN